MSSAVLDAIPSRKRGRVQRGGATMSGAPDLNAREILHRELLEHEQRLRQFIGQAFGEDRTNPVVSAPPAVAASLTPRDIEILGLLVLGQTNRQIGMQVRVGPGTVRNHLSR